MKRINSATLVDLLKAVLFIVPGISIPLFFLTSYCMIDNWFIELMGFVIPLLLIINFMLFILAWVFFKKLQFLLLPLLTLLVGLHPMQKTFAFNIQPQKEESDFSIVSFNAATFDPFRMGNTNGKNFSGNTAIYKWLRENESPDIFCIQEFYHSDLNEQNNTLDSIAMLGGYKYYYTNPTYVDEFGGIVGVITYSKFEAINSGEISYGEDAFNRGNYHDFKIKDDTIRVINFHLKSMSIRWHENNERSFVKQAAFNITDIYKKLKAGYCERKDQLAQVEKLIKETPYKTVLCADLNAVPFSLTYKSLRENFNNAFEEAGIGFGISYHHFPWFIRIDNQFYDQRLKINYYTTHNRIKVSDHYPIEAGYSLN